MRSPYPKSPRALSELGSSLPKCPSKSFGAWGLEEFLKAFFRLNFFLYAERTLDYETLGCKSARTLLQRIQVRHFHFQVQQLL